ncbi:hypothetical protein JCM11641_000003 [Rhodosporidiobolus odoratus]
MRRSGVKFRRPRVGNIVHPMTASLTSATAAQAAKKQLRKQVTARLKQLSPEEVTSDSNAILQRLISSPYYAHAAAISCYLSTPVGEVQTDGLIRHALSEGKRIYVPYCPVESKTEMRMLRLRDVGHWEGLKENRWGIKEVDPSEVDSLESADDPAVSSGLDLILVPGLAFDPLRRRLGHGRGYYDRYITACLDYPKRFDKPAPRTIALALRAQLVREEDGEHIPTNEWDRLPEILLTPDGGIN